MFSKIYLALFAISLIIMGWLVYFTNSWLQSIGRPEDALANFEFYSGFGWQFLLISSLILLIIANVILWMTRNSWALWVTFGYFAVFVLLNTWWLTENLSAFNQRNNFPQSSVLVNGITGAFVCVIVGVGIFFNQFIVFRLREKMFNKPKDEIIVAENEAGKESLSE